MNPIVLLFLTLLALLAQAADIPRSGPTSVPYERLVNATHEPQNWLTYWGDYGGTRFRNLNRINDSNVKRLRVEWIYQAEQPATETVPLVIDGIMYFTASNGFVFALDPKTGRELWRYHYIVPENLKGCCGGLNRGLAVLGPRLFLATPDAHLVALDARDGQPLWNISFAPNAKGYGATFAPLAVNGKIIVGTSGGEFGARGFLAAFDAASGKELWRFFTIPAKGEPGSETWGGDSGARGGAPTWMTGTFDPETNTLYWGVGNPGPDLNGDVRPGDNLYSDCLIALDADTGKLKWHFQFTPHDTHDWDAAETPMLLDLPWQGKPRKLVVQANRNSFYYVLDRATGEFLYAKAFARQNWAMGIDAKGRPILAPEKRSADEGSDICPGQAGGTNWMAPSFQPSLGLFYLTIREQCDTFHTNPVTYKEGRPYIGGSQRGVENQREYGLVAALDVLTGENRWSFRLNRAPWAGTLSTAGNLLFAGDEDGYLMAFNAKTGQLLWKINTGTRLVTSPITYEVEGRQYVTMPSGSAILTFALAEE